jgi:hypothetical protein
MEPLDGIAEADLLLGRAVPLPGLPLPLARWVEVTSHGPGAVEVIWNLDDSRPGAPARLALYAGERPPAERQLPAETSPRDLGDGLVHREAALSEAQPSLRPVHELRWRCDGLELRLTAQGPWSLGDLVAIAHSVG